MTPPSRTPKQRTQDALEQRSFLGEIFPVSHDALLASRTTTGDLRLTVLAIA